MQAVAVAAVTTRDRRPPDQLPRDADEHGEIAARARRDGISLSDYVRVRLGLRGDGAPDGDEDTTDLADETAIRALLADYDRRLTSLEATAVAAAAVAAMDDTAIRDLVVRLARPHPAGGKVIERAAILASGAGSEEVVQWIIRRAGRGEVAAVRGGAGGLLRREHRSDGAAAPLHPAARRARLSAPDRPDPLARLDHRALRELGEHGGGGELDGEQREQHDELRGGGLLG